MSRWSPSPWCACTWALQREDGEAVYDFTAVYTLARLDNGLRIVAAAHDELPKLQVALHGLRRAPLHD